MTKAGGFVKTKGFERRWRIREEVASLVNIGLLALNLSSLGGKDTVCPPGIGGVVYTQEIYSLHSVGQRKSECPSCIGCSFNFNSKKINISKWHILGGTLCFSLYVQQQE